MASYTHIHILFPYAQKEDKTFKAKLKYNAESISNDFNEGLPLNVKSTQTTRLICVSESKPCEYSIHLYDDYHLISLWNAYDK